MEYLDFVIRVEPAQGDVFPVKVLTSPYGEAASEMSRPRIEEIAGLLSRFTLSEPDAQQIGAFLFDALFIGPVRQLFDVSAAGVAERDANLRIKILVDAREPTLAAVASLPWELMYRKEEDAFLSLSAYTPVMRVLDTSRVPAPASLQPFLHVLVVVCQPDASQLFDAKAEQQRIKEGWGRQSGIRVDFLEPATLPSLQRALHARPYNVLHYIGPDAPVAEGNRPTLVLETEDGERMPVDGRKLGILLQDTRSLRLVVLNQFAGVAASQLPASFSRLGASLLTAGIPAVVAAQYPFTLSAASVFENSFYEALLHGQAVDSAIAVSRQALFLYEPDSAQWAAPVLYMSRPDGVIFSVSNAQLLEPPVPPDELVEACKKGECAIFAGAGLSAPAGYPLWGALVEQLLTWALDNELVDPKLGISYRTALQSGQADLAADGLVSALLSTDPTGERLTNHVREIMEKQAATLTEAHRLLNDIGFTCGLTTNYDSMLEKALDARVYTPGDAGALMQALAEQERFVVKLFGSLDRPGQVAFSPSGYRDTIGANQTFLEFAGKLLLSRTLLFLGTSLDGVQWNLDALGYRGSARRHYALAAVSGADWQVKADLLVRRYNVQVLPYLPSEGHPEVAAFLSLLSSRAPAAQVAGAETRPAREPPRLATVHLENIGPFDALDLELDPNWNILLGDNGVGKSTIMRAIALALCGDEARTYADRIVSLGKPTGKVALGFADGASIVAELYRTSRGPDMKRVSTLDVFGTVNWLAIGFPPLRHFGWQPLSGPQKSPNRPLATTPGDLLPLLEGDPDPRMVDLKQAIIDLDYQARIEGEQGRARRLFDDFFRVIGLLTTGMTLEFSDIDPSSWTIYVKTDDGRLPLEFLSQGTHSLMGWVGQLLGRLYDVYTRPDLNPREQPAVVLIDEIDAHMHPLWQQVVVPGLTRLFPNTQFLATTHSPMVVANAPPQSVFRLRRDEENVRKVILDRPNLDLRRWRADQVLTSPLFDLPSTLNQETYQAQRRYTELSARSDLSEAEQQELLACAARLQVRPPTAHETQIAREAFESIEQSLDEKLKSMPPERQKQLLEEARAQVLENVTGSRRSL